MRDPMILSAFFFNPQGDHRMSWRHSAAPGREVFGFDYYRDLAETAERGRLDLIFAADHVAMWDTYESNIAHYANARLEPLTLLAGLAAATRHIGLLPTISTSYSEPYNVARMLASLDQIGRGRFGWNVVTSGMPEEGLNFGQAGNIDHAVRYERAAEFLDVVKALWDSVEDEALLLDKASGRFADPRKVHRVDHTGRHFKVRGPLNVPRSPQGHPVIFQAGSSEHGKSFAAAQADVNFAILRSPEDGVRYRRDFDERLLRAGRRPEDLKVLAGVLPFVGESRAEAEDRRAGLEALMPVALAVDLASSWSGIDLSRHPLDGPLPPLPEVATYDGQRSNLARVAGYVREGLTIREVARRIANAETAPTLVGTATDVADQLEAWHAAGAADGFVLMFPILPGDLALFVDRVVPELRRRGLVRPDYQPGTLRDRLGLPRPVNRYAGE